MNQSVRLSSGARMAGRRTQSAAGSLRKPYNGPMILTKAKVPRETFEAGTGWQLKPEGACKGPVCVPLAVGAVASQSHVDGVAVAEAIGLPVVHDEEHGVCAIGPESIGSRALVSAEDADFELPDLEGKPFRLSSLRGQKVLVYAWAPY